MCIRDRASAAGPRRCRRARRRRAAGTSSELQGRKGVAGRTSLPSSLPAGSLTRSTAPEGHGPPAARLAPTLASPPQSTDRLISPPPQWSATVTDRSIPGDARGGKSWYRQNSRWRVNRGVGPHGVTSDRSDGAAQGLRAPQRPGRRVVQGRGGRDLRAARAERRGEDHHRRVLRGPAPAGRRECAGARPGPGAAGGGVAVADRGAAATGPASGRVAGRRGAGAVRVVLPPAA